MAGVAQAYQHLLTIDCLSFAFRLTRRVAVRNVVSSTLAADCCVNNIKFASYEESTLDMHAHYKETAIF